MAHKQPQNEIKLSILSTSENVGFARVAAASFATQLDLTVSEIDEIKVAVSEAVSNSVIHAYGVNSRGRDFIEIIMCLYTDRLEFTVIDFGKGIENIEEARQPSFSSDPERMGLGFAFMESFMDELDIKSFPGKGTTVKMVKNIADIARH